MSHSLNITVSEDVSVVTFYNVPSDLSFMSVVFGELSKNNINLDMITKSVPVGSHTSISFTVSDSDIGTVLGLIPTFRQLSPDIKSTVSSGNTKIAVQGDFMRDCVGVAAKVFESASKTGAEIRLVTTSEVDISMLIDKSSEAGVVKAISELEF